ncbi:NBR1-Ig-like domain-containing protein [Microbacterium sp. SS28]|uniref:NBR1-Ig-like domain-containing protein n=1 Tax=Microbacterium sp. SS28 TaxID=2919948 RepID=UPI001FA96B2D|nr:NBR1-Ig-like domain-containing protein [Microbacterium sp. SS28]
MPRPRRPPARHDTQRQQFGDELRYWRELRGYTVAELAGQVGRDRRTISGAEDGRDMPSEAVIHQLESALNSGGLLLARYDAVLAEKRKQRLERNTVTSVPSPDADPTDASTFIGETISDGSLMHPGQRFIKTWTIRNDGTIHWNRRYLTRLGIAAGPGLITTPTRVPVPSASPGDQITIEVPCVAHFIEGTSAAAFKMTDDEGRLYFPGRYFPGLQVQVTVVR